VRKLLVAAVLFFAPAAFSGTCPPDEPLLKVDGRTVNYSYFEFVESRLPKWALRRFYSGLSGREKLLEKIGQRQLILTYYEKRGYFNDPVVKRRLEKFKIDELISMLVNKRLSEVKVSPEEVEKALEKYPPKERARLRKFVEINIKAHKFEDAERKLYSGAMRGVKIVNLHPEKEGDVVAVYPGGKVTYGELQPLLNGSSSAEALKRAVRDYMLYLKAKAQGLDRTEKFKNELLYYKESFAVKAFESEIASQVKVSDDEVKRYYREHKQEFRTPERAKVTVYPFESEEAAKEALQKLKKGIPPAKAIPKEVFSRGRVVEVEEGQNNPVAQLVFTEKGKKLYLLNVPSGKTLLVVLDRFVPSRVLGYGDVYTTIKNRLKVEKERRLVKRKLEELKKEFGVKALRGALVCLGSEKSD
jgi:hypothetical protein